MPLLAKFREGQLPPRKASLDNTNPRPPLQPTHASSGTAPDAAALMSQLITSLNITTPKSVSFPETDVGAESYAVAQSATLRSALNRRSRIDGQPRAASSRETSSHSSRDRAASYERRREESYRKRREDSYQRRRDLSDERHRAAQPRAHRPPTPTHEGYDKPKQGNRYQSPGRSPRRGEYRAPTCYYCHRVGHVIRDCRTRQRNNAGNTSSQPKNY